MPRRSPGERRAVRKCSFDPVAKAAMEQQIFRRIAGEREFGKKYEIRADRTLGHGKHAIGVAFGVTDEQVDLREGDAQGRSAQALRRLRSCSSIAVPSSAGDLTVRTPAASSARNLSAAVPLPPAMTAPA